MKQICALILVISLFFCCTPPICAAPSVSAHCAILIDAATSDVLFEKNADETLAMASTTKIMTALVVLQHADLSRVIAVPKQAVGIEGSSAYLYEGEKISVRDLVFALLLQSANDAAVALALHVSGNIEDFASLMNQTATVLGLTDSSFQNPHGLPATNHYSTARDLARLMQKALENEEFLAISGAKNYHTKQHENGTVHYFRNHNRLLFDDERCISGKTGYTKAAGRCLVSAAEENGARLICVTLSAPDDWNDHKALYNHGFSQYETQVLYEKGDLFCDLRVVGSVDKSIRVENLSTVSAALRTKDSVTVSYDLPHFVYAPIEGMDTLNSEAPSPPDAMCAGFALITQGEREIARVKLYYTTSVTEYVPPTIWERILQFFGWKKSESKNS